MRNVKKVLGILRIAQIAVAAMLTILMAKAMKTLYLLLRETGGI